MADQQQNDDSNQLTDTEIERLKIYQDSFKHMMTFNSGGILLSAAATGALFPKPEFPVLLAFSIFMLSTGALSAMLGLVYVPRHIDSAIGGNTRPTISLRSYLQWSMLTAYAGLSLFAIFAALNIWPS